MKAKNQAKPQNPAKPNIKIKPSQTQSQSCLKNKF
jgi:hypothetical protein